MAQTRARVSQAGAALGNEVLAVEQSSQTLNTVLSDMSGLLFESPDPSLFIVATGVIALAWAGFNFNVISGISLDDVKRMDQSNDRTALSTHVATEAQMAQVREVYEAVKTGANAFLRAEYTICLQFVVLFGLLIFVLISW